MWQASDLGGGQDDREAGCTCPWTGDIVELDPSCPLHGEVTA
jgi:hypothetical protein